MGRQSQYVCVIDSGRYASGTERVVRVAVQHPEYDGKYGEVSLSIEEARALARALVRQADAADSRADAASLRRARGDDGRLK